MKRENFHISVIFNEPTVKLPTGRHFLSDSGLMGKEGSYNSIKDNNFVDLSEVGVVEVKEDIESALRSLGYRTTIFNMSNNVNRLLDFFGKDRPHLIFNLVESLGDQALHEMHVAGIFEVMGIAYTGSGPLTLGSCLNKGRTKEILRYHSIPSPAFILCNSLAELNADDLALQFPLIVKPAKEDASVGISNDSIVRSFSELIERVEFILKRFEQPALIEEYIDGRELNVAILGNNPGSVLPISEIDFSGLPNSLPKIVTYDAKWMRGSIEYEGTKGVCPAKLPPDTQIKIEHLAMQAYTIMGCRDYARVDIRLRKDYQPFVLEVNPNPDISDDSGYIRSARTSGLSYGETVGRIVEHALSRYPLLQAMAE